MALTRFQRDVCRLLADRRRASGESYIAGGAALIEALAMQRVSRDPGFTPAGILAQAARASHYSQAEIDALAFADEPPKADALSRAWHAALDQARQLVHLLPAERAGMAILHGRGELFRGGPAELADALAAGALTFHEGGLRGAWPHVREP